MTESRRPHAWAWLALAWLLVVGALAWQQAGFWREGRLDSDVLALLPGAHEDPRQAQANARLAEGGTRQVVVLLGHADWATLRRGAEAFSASLREDPRLAPLADDESGAPPLVSPLQQDPR